MTGLLATSLAVSCGAEPEPCIGETTASCDVTFSACREALAAATACLMGVDDYRLPEIRFRSEEDVIAEWRRRLEFEPAPGAEDDRRSLARLGLIAPEHAALRDELEFRFENVGGYYESDGQRITLISDNAPRDDQKRVLVHELVHAFQDQLAPLDDYFEAHVNSLDSQLTALAEIEGQADLIQTRVDVDLDGGVFGLVRWPDYFEQLRVFATDLAIQTPSPYLRTPGIYPYVWGTERWIMDFSVGAYRVRLPAPLGSTAEGLTGRRRGRALPSLDGVEPPDADFELAWEEVVGAFTLAARLEDEESTFARDRFFEHVQSWEDDGLAVYRRPADGAEVVLWRILTASPTTAARLAGAAARADLEVEREASVVVIVAGTDGLSRDPWFDFGRAHVAPKAKRRHRKASTARPPLGPAIVF